MILQEIDDLIKEMNDFRFRFKPGPSEPINYLRQNNSDIIDPVNIAKESRAQEKKDVVDRLLAQASSPDLTVLPIVGMGGLSKTTLAQLIYNDPEISKHFQLRLWVCVSDNFDVLKLASAANLRFLPCLESLTIWRCNGLSEVANLPPSIKTLGIYYCGNLQSLSGQLGDIQKLTIDSCSLLESLDSCLGELRSLEELELYGCKSLVSLPDGPQAYSSLRVLGIEHCDGVKSLPPSLQSRLDCLEQKDLDARYEGNIY